MNIVIIIIVGVAILGVLSAILSINQKAPDENQQAPKSDVCCGQHITCEKDSLLSAVSPNIEYYDDEELDKYKGLNADDYSNDDIDIFRDILETLNDDDVAGWVRSLQNRDINIPREILDEIFLRVGENRQYHSDLSN